MGVGTERCKVDGCTSSVSKPGHELCLAHWKAQRAGHLAHCVRCSTFVEMKTAADKPTLCSKCLAASSSHDDADDAPAGLLSSTKIGQHFGLSNIKINLILAELGWIEKYVKGWTPTDRGNALGANVKEMRNGTPFVVWPTSILTNTALQDSVEEQTPTTRAKDNSPPLAGGAAVGEALTAGGGGGKQSKTETRPGAKDDFRQKFPAAFRTQDGHQVRSRAEVLIDNWLYMQGIVHAYERRLPIEEECYCDFYLPGGKGVYIEYWGLENDAKYRARKAAKQALYAKYGLRLIELGDAEIERLDDVLPRMLLKFGIESV